MKKVLVLTVIAILALGVMTMATPTYVGESGSHNYSVEPTCETATLTVTSNIVVVQGFEATATAYDATFCGATGDPLKNSYYSGGTIHSGDNVILAVLSVKSNMSTITVTVSATDNLSTHISPTYYPSTPNNSGPNWSWSATQFTSGNLLTLYSINSSGSPYEGALAVVAPSGVTQWTEAGAYTATIQFVVTPKTSGF